VVAVREAPGIIHRQWWVDAEITATNGRGFIRRAIAGLSSSSDN
jgi:hypothetical protein